MTVAEPIFLDTSLIVAAAVEEHPSHHPALAYIDRLKALRSPTCISPQVCREFVVVLTRKAIGPRVLPPEEALAALSDWTSSCDLLDETGASLRALAGTGRSA
jgi:predicted nucleic acid-binding protein